jgi:acetyl-CoA C-acetyltransferase
MNASAADRMPVLVGIGVATRHEEDYTQAPEAMDLMLEAVAAAGDDATSASVLEGLQYIAVPRGRWSYSNPAGEIARKYGAQDAVTVLSTPGVLQQTLVGEACVRIARGEAHTTLVAGSDAGYRILKAQIAKGHASERAQNDHPDICMMPKDELRHDVEKRSGLQMPVGLYAIMESAYRARQGWSIAEHRDRLAALWSRFSEIAQYNPHAWRKQSVSAAVIRDVSDRNPMQAFPYTRFHCSTWNVDQASALLFCSAARADALGIPRAKWVFPLASTESNHMVPVSARADLSSCPGAGITGRAALAAGDLTVEQIDLVDLYSCFPLAVETYAAEVGLSLTRDLTVTGGMAFAGGPYNNYFLQSTCRAAELLREGKGRNALLSCASGVVTKQAFALWSVDEPTRPFVHADLTAQVEREVAVREVAEHFSGNAKVAGYTVLYGRGQMPKAVVLVDTTDSKRAMATSEDAALIAAMEQNEMVGCSVTITDNQLVAIS